MSGHRLLIPAQMFVVRELEMALFDVVGGHSSEAESGDHYDHAEAELRNVMKPVGCWLRFSSSSLDCHVLILPWMHTIGGQVHPPLCIEAWR